MIVRWLDRRAWRVVMDPRSRGLQLQRARRRVRRQGLVLEAVERRAAERRAR